MRIDVFSILPEVMAPYLSASIVGKALESELLTVELHDLRDYTEDRHRTTDDEPYGGGGGMIMKPEPIFSAVESAFDKVSNETPIILLTPQGRLFDQSVAVELAAHDRLALVCGRYEGVDERVRQHLVTDEISIGDYVLTGGELPALVVIDAVARLLPGVLGDAGAADRDSHANGLLEHPHYTRPASFRRWQVPEILRSGDHKAIERWRRAESLRRTLLRRPDLLSRADLSEAERENLAILWQELNTKGDEA
ncbi:MAG: tRNA (guanosine(37)-N1)-methyltransferase TrmD [Anaerolineales bacterium]